MQQPIKKIHELSQSRNGEQITFRSLTSISRSVLKSISEKGKQYGIESIKSFATDKLEFGEWVGLKCRYGCAKFGTNWSCPPATPNSQKSREIVLEYSIALLLTGTLQCKNFYLNNNKTRSEQVRYWKGTVSIERQLLLQGYDKAFSLVAGSCSLCKTCAYPEACRFPAEKRPTIESFTIDMIGTLKNLGIGTAVARDPKEPFKYYAMILLV